MVACIRFGNHPTHCNCKRWTSSTDAMLIQEYLACYVAYSIPRVRTDRYCTVHVPDRTHLDRSFHFHSYHLHSYRLHNPSRSLQPHIHCCRKQSGFAVCWRPIWQPLWAPPTWAFPHDSLPFEQPAELVAGWIFRNQERLGAR